MLPYFLNPGSFSSINQWKNLASRVFFFHCNILRVVWIEKITLAVCFNLWGNLKESKGHRFVKFKHEMQYYSCWFSVQRRWWKNKNNQSLCPARVLLIFLKISLFCDLFRSYSHCCSLRKFRFIKFVLSNWGPYGLSIRFRTKTFSINIRPIKLFHQSSSK